jgi:hypothetical protein
MRALGSSSPLGQEPIFLQAQQVQTLLFAQRDVMGDQGGQPQAVH